MTLRFPSRFLGGTVAIGFLAAIAVGRMYGPAPALRSAEMVRYVGIADPGRADSSHTARFLDLSSGEIQSFEVPDGDSLSRPSCSPWRDERGQRQVVGRWLRQAGQDIERVTTAFGLARYTFPGGEPLNRVATDILPEGSPCWYPGTRARILFANSHGTLFRFAFEGSTAPDASPEGCDARPVPIVWKVAPPGDDERSVHISDPVWPDGRGFGGRILVTLQTEVREGGICRRSPPRLWSLLLDAEGSAIVSARPLSAEADASQAGFWERKERMPRTGRGPDGRDRVAYLSKDSEQDPWEVRVVEVSAGSDGTPQIVSELRTPFHRACGLAAPAFSLDGRWIYYCPSNPLELGVPRTSALPAEPLASR